MKPLLLALCVSLLFSLPSFSQNTLDNAGLTSASPSSVAYSLRKLSSSYSGPAIKVRRSTDNAEAIVAFDGSNTVGASSLVTFTGGVQVSNTLGVTQSGTISSDASKTGTITIKSGKTGTLNTLISSLTVTGTGTSFLTELSAGDQLFNSLNNSLIGVVASISSNSSLSLNNYATGTANTISYKTTNAVVTGTGTNFTGELVVGDQLFNTSNTYLGTVSTIISATSLSLHAADAVSATAITFKGSTALIVGAGTNFTSLSVGDLLISNNITLGIISFITNASSLTLSTKAGGSVSGMAYKSTSGTIPFSSYYASASVFLNTWYDQSGNNRNIIQTKPGNQARIVNSGTLYTRNGKTSMEFSTSLASFLHTSAPASYLNNTRYTLNKVTAEASINGGLQPVISTTGGSGPINTVSHFGYRSSALFTIAQYNHDQDFNAAPSTSLEVHTGIKITTASSQFYKNGYSQGISSNGVAADLLNVGLLSIGLYTPTSSYYNGGVSEVIIFPSALNTANNALLNNNQLAYYNIINIYWTGALSTDWNNIGNWSNATIPDISAPSMVLIPSGMPNYPVINTTGQVNSILIETGASLIVTGVMQVAGTINTQGSFTASSGTIQYAGTVPQVIAASTFAGNTVQNIIINNSTGVTLNGNISTSGNLTFTTGFISLNNSVLTIGGLITNTVSGGLKGSANGSLVVNGTVSPMLSFNQSVPGTSNSLKNLTINSSGQIINLSNNLVLNTGGTTTFTAGKLAIGNSTLTIRGLVVNTVNEALTGSSSANVIVDGIVSKTLSFDQTTAGNTNALNSLTINCSGQSLSLNRNLVVVSALTVTEGTLADGGYQISSTGTLNLVNGTFKLGSLSVATAWPLFAVNNISPGGTADYAAGVPQIVSGVPAYQNLIISATGGATAASDITVNGILSLPAANPSAVLGSLSMSSYTLNMGASAITSGQGDVTGIVKRTSILPNINYSMGNEFTYIVFPATGTLPSQMSMKIGIGTAPLWRPGAISRRYDFIQTGGSGTKAVIAAHYLDSELNGNIENKLVDFSYRFTGSVLTEHGKSNFNTTQNWVGLSNVNVAFFSSSFGLVELSLDESTLTTLTWNGSTSTSWITATNWTPNGGPSTNTQLIIPDAATTPNDPSLPATASNGSLSIEAGGIVNSDALAQLTLNNAGLALSNNGTFNGGSSNIIFTNAGATINGTTNFNHVTINSGANLLLTTGSVMRIAGTVTNNGAWSAGLLENTVEYNGNNQTIIVPNGSTQSYHNLIISGSGTSILPPVSLNILGNLTVNGTISSTGNTISMNGLDAQTISGTGPITLNNLSINYSPFDVSMNQNLTIGGTLSLIQGKLAIGNNTLSLSGNIINTIPNGLKGGSNSNLVISGAASPVISFDISQPGLSNSLNNLTINSTSQVPLLGSDLEVKGTLLLSAGKLGINGNTLTLSGAVNNTMSGGLRGSSTSNLIISGGMASPVISFDQTTTGTTNLLNNLSVNSTGQSAILGNPLLVGGSLGLTEGLLGTSTLNSLTLKPLASFTGGSDLSFVNGPLIRNTLGTASYDFPLGKNNLYAPASISPLNADPGAYRAEFFPVQGPAGIIAAGITAVNTDEYWDINKISGPDAKLTLMYTAGYTWSSGSPTTADNIFVVQLNAGIWEAENGTVIPGNTASGMTPVTTKDLSSFSLFKFGYSMSVILPVKLISFKVGTVTESIELLWTSAEEIELARYEIERSTDGYNFYKIGSLPAANNVSLIKTYKWVDQSPVSGTNYYRLKMIDTDDSYRYSNHVKAAIKSSGTILIYPNPVAGNTIQMQMTGQLNGNYVLNLYNNKGEKVQVYKRSVTGNGGTQRLGLNPNLQNGIYYLEMNSPDNRKTTFKVSINR